MAGRLVLSVSLYLKGGQLPLFKSRFKLLNKSGFLNRQTNDTYLIELSCVFVAVVNSNSSTINGDVLANTEVGGHVWTLRAVAFEDHLSLEESSLGASRVLLTGFTDHDGLVL